MAEQRSWPRRADFCCAHDLPKPDNAEEDNGEGDDARFKYEFPDAFPFKSVAMAFFLLSLGSCFLLISHFIFAKHMAGDRDQGYGFLFLGSIVFMPGFYEIRVAYYTLRGSKGFSYSRIIA